MIDRFRGDEGRRVLIEALLGQKPVRGNLSVAEKLADVAQLAAYKPGEVLIKQEDDDNDIIFILNGRVSITINGNHVAERQTNQHVGEMALIDPVGRRTATVRATTLTTVAKISAAEFIPVADANPFIWRLLAAELVERIRQRGDSLKEPNPQPRVFIGSSVEGLAVADAIQSGLNHAGAVVEVWSQNVFKASSGTMETLEQKAASSDFAVLVATADDKAKVRGKQLKVARDNVIFELGLFMGQIGRKRTVLVVPRGVNMHVPTDFLGITPLEYEPPTDLGDLPAAVGPACTELKRMIRNLGAR